MGKLSFFGLLPEETGKFLPQMFDILYTNMTALTPSDTGYEENLAMWKSYILPALEQGKVQVILMLAGDTLAGYFQYSIRGDVLLVEEVEIRSEYQRTMLFYRGCQFLMANLPEGIRYLESYVNKRNQNSLSIQGKLSMEIVGENKSGSSWHMRGSAEAISKRLNRK